jgi:4-diphosphocytidyl-2-C-methyl-D-erythritol kinase
MGGFIPRGRQRCVLTLKAYAKVNLVLEVLARRGDGFHEIASIMQTVGLHDVLTFEAADEMEFSCSVPALQAGDNLVWKAIRALREATGETTAARISLEKNIPPDAGLGGGSSDAAAALKGLNRLWGLGLTAENLAEIAAGVGSDVPFFIYGGSCLVQGRGEKITPLPDMQGAWFILLNPGIAVPVKKTAALYALVKPVHYSRGGLAAAAASLLKEGKTLVGKCYNTFDTVAAGAYSGMQRYREALDKAGAREVHLAGSGPFLFSLFGSLGEARHVQAKLSLLNIDSILAPGVTRDEAGH